MKLSTWCLRWCVAADDRDAIDGDLRHEYAAMRDRGASRWRANVWLAREVAVACAYGLASRIRESVPSRSGLRVEIREAIRVLRRRPASTLAMIVTLALGIGANTGMFTVLNAALWRPLPFPSPDQLVVIREYQRNKSDSSRGVSYLNFADWRAESRAFESMALATLDTGSLKLAESVVKAEGAIVSPGFFHTLGVSAAMGTTFDAIGDDGLSRFGLPAIMLSDAGWRRYFHADPGIVGREVELDGRRSEIVGVTPAGILPLATEPIDFWSTARTLGNPTDPSSANGSRNFRQYAGVLARLRSGVSRDEAQRELDAIGAGLLARYPRAMANRGVSIEPLRDVFVGDSAKTLWLLFGMVSVVLLIACVNVANVCLARASTRQREVAIRGALGARRIDIVRQFVTESVLVSLTGGACGLWLSVWLVSVLSALLPAEVPKVAGLTPDWRVFAFALAAALVTGLICGVVPAWSATRARASASSSLSDGRRSASGPVPRRLRDALIAMEVAAALALLVAAGLMTNSLVRLGRVAPGFDGKQLLTTRLSLDGDRYEGGSVHAPRINRVLDDLDARLRQLPGVNDVAFAQSVPLTGVENSTEFSIPGRPAPVGKGPTAGLRFVSASYFHTMRIPFVDGRAFSAQDRDGAPPVVAVNEAFVREFLPGEVALGRMLSLGWGGETPKQIVAIVGDVRHKSLGDRPRPEMYVPQAQFGNTSVTVVMRSAATTDAIGPAMLAAIHDVDPLLALSGVKTLDDYRADTLAVPRFGAWLLGGFGVLALLLTTVGLYGVTSYTTAQRTQEIGVRMALGAQVSDVLRLVIRQGAQPVLVGLAIGVLGALAASRALGAWLYEVAPTDPWTLISVASLLAVVALLACYIPARRASRVDPLLALRGN